MTPFDCSGYGAGAYLIVRGLAVLVKRCRGPEGWRIRVYPLTLALWAIVGAFVPFMLEVTTI